MCGIIISKDNKKIDLISHRGIQQNQIFYEGMWYGHVRLPIQTLASDEPQPHYLGEDNFFMFNGEIFNYDKSSYVSDTEYLRDFLRTYDTFTKLTSKEALDEMNKWDGFWSIVMVNKDCIIAFTDPLGKKQLYRNTEGEICSEITPLAGKILDYKFMSTVSKFGYNMDSSTPYVNVKRLLPNIIFEFKDSSIRVMENYFDINTPPATNDLYDLLNTAVQNRLVSREYEIGLFLSGGLDSTIITGLLERSGTPVKYYSIENGEKEYVDLVQDYYGIDVEYLKYDELDNKEIYLKNETPIDLGSVIPQFNLFQNAKERIIISGDGADELFGGYRRITEYDSQKSDIFDELSFYHLPRLDRASMTYTIELRTPFLSHDIVRYALNLGYSKRINKSILKDTFGDIIPKEVRDRVKVPLKTDAIKNDKIQARLDLVNNFIQWKS